MPQRKQLSLLLLICCINECLSTPNRPSTTFPYYQRDASKSLPYNLRGGSTLATAQLKQKQRRQQRLRRKPELLIKVHQLTIQLHDKSSHSIHQLQSNFDKDLQALIVQLQKIKLPQFKKKHNSALEEVCTSFSSVHSNSKIDTASLLKACRSHLSLMKSAGSSLKLVAKDLESNLAKCEKLYNSHTDKCRTLSNLLSFERGLGIHDGNILKDPSAAIGLLWIRRSLAFQCELYSSLMYKSVHPKEAAMNAYVKHLKPYHGWALGKLFEASLSQMPGREAFIAKFGGVDVDDLDESVDGEVVNRLRTLTDCWDPMLDCWKGEFERLGLEDTRRV
jgi:hypothetical protein